MMYTERVSLSPHSGREWGEERGSVFHPDRFLKTVEGPSLHLHRGEKEPSAWVVICPGGGYGGVCIDKEGHEVARLLNAWGMGAAVLYYRLPDPSIYEEPPRPLADAWAAMDHVRGLAAGKKVGLMGFSAGGHLALAAALDQPSRPTDFLILGYPVVSSDPALSHGSSFNNLLGPSAPANRLARFSMEYRVTSKSPVAFAVHAEDDKSVPVQNSIALEKAYQKAGVSFTLCQKSWGGHGFGLPHGPKNNVPDWSADLHHWLVAQGFIEN